MQSGVSGGSLTGGHESSGGGGGVMLDRLEHLLPIPTGAKMDRWRKMVIQRIERKKRMKQKEERKETKMHKDIFVHHVHRQSE